MSELKNMYKTRNEGSFEESMTINGKEYVKVCDLRYGDNPNQPAAFYRPADDSCFFGSLKELKSGKNGMSLTNLADMHHAINVIKYFEQPAVAVMKHLNPSGVAVHADVCTAYEQARDCDSRAAFGSVVVVNRPVDLSLAQSINTTFVEAVCAPRVSDEALAEFNTKKNLRVVTMDFSNVPRFKGDDTQGYVEVKKLGSGSIALQEPYLASIRSIDDCIAPRAAKKDGTQVRIAREPTAQEAHDLLFAWYVNTGVRSNGVVFAKNGRTIAVGTGEQERVGAVEQAIAKANGKHPGELRGAVVASDGFFPFSDSIELLAKEGITAVIQPGGSVRDAEVIEACNKHDIAMVFTGERCFGHF